LEGKDDARENLTDAMKSDIRDADEFLPLAARIPIVPEVEEFRLEQANEALLLLKQSRISAAAVLKVQG
jgi:propanol-preferring alcohol dehydrogenase